MILKKNDRVSVYLIASKLKHREKMLVDLAPYFKKFKIVTFEGEKTGSDHVVIKPWVNPTGIFRLIGLDRFKAFLDRYLFFPSKAILCVNAAKKSLNICIENDLKGGLKVCVISTTPPHGLTLLGWHLKNKYPEVNWIIDWQDLWSYDESYLRLVPKLYRKRLMRLEKSILHSCDLNVTSNFKAADILSKHYHVKKNKLTQISHPYHETDAVMFSNHKSKDQVQKKKITIGFLGQISKPPKVPGDRILQAISDVVADDFDLEFHIYGDKSKLTKKLLSQFKNGRFILHESLPHKESLLAISTCDFLLIALSDLPNCHVIMHAKLPHYLILNKPIIAMVPHDSFVAHVVEKTGSGVIIPSHTDWGKELNKYLVKYRDGKLLCDRNAEEIKKYSWHNISQQWIEAISIMK